MSALSKQIKLDKKKGYNLFSEALFVLDILANAFFVIVQLVGLYFLQNGNLN